MVKLNKQVNLPELTKIMTEFAKQSEMMEMKQDMVGDAIDDVMDDVEDETESENIVNQVLDEIGINLNEGLVDAPGKKLEVEKEQEVKKEDGDKALEARFNNLDK